MNKLFVLGIFACVAGLAQTDKTAVLFDASKLHEVRIGLSPADWEALKAAPENDDTYYNGTFRFDGTELAGVGFRQKGHGSRTPLKPSIKVKFGEFNDGETFLGLKGLGLKSNVDDASQIKQRMAMGLFNRVGLAAPRQSSAKLYINNEYFGLYGVDEDVDKVFLKRVYGESGGNLYEVQGLPSYHFEFLGSDASPYVPVHFEPKSPDEPDTSALVALITAVNQASDADFQSAVGQYLDWNIFMTQLAAEAYVTDYDAIAGVSGINNFYLYQMDGTNKFISIPKDTDLTFEQPYTGIYDRYDENVLLRRAMATPALKRLYLQMLAKVSAVAGGRDGWLERETVAAAAQVREAVYADPSRQCFEADCTNESFDEQVAAERSYADLRMDSIGQQIAAAGLGADASAPTVFAGGVVDAYSYAEMLTPGGYFSIFGTNLGGETSVYVNGFRAVLTYVSDGQINGVAPVEAAGGRYPVVVVSGRGVSGVDWVQTGVQ